MTIHDPHRHIVDYAEIETVCPSCGHAATRSDLSDVAKHALVTATVDIRLRTERCRLRRAKELIELFPNSRHPFIVAKMNLKADVPTAPDASFEAMLDDELREILGPKCQFYLPARLAWLEEAVPDSPPFVTSHREIACPKCSHFLILPESFYYRIG